MMAGQGIASIEVLGNSNWVRNWGISMVYYPDGHEKSVG